MPIVITTMKSEACFPATFHTIAVNMLKFISQSSTKHGRINISSVIVIVIYFSSLLHFFADAPGGIAGE